MLGLLAVGRAVVLDGLSGRAGPRDGGTIDGLEARLVERETPRPDGTYGWTARWRLCWQPVEGAADYVLTAISIEGPGEPMAVAGPCHEITVASGTSTAPGERSGLAAQLDLMAASLSVSVAARFPDGSTGPPSPDLPVGDVHP